MWGGGGVGALTITANSLHAQTKRQYFSWLLTVLIRLIIESESRFVIISYHGVLYVIFCLWLEVYTHFVNCTHNKYFICYVSYNWQPLRRRKKKHQKSKSTKITTLHVHHTFWCTSPMFTAQLRRQTFLLIDRTLPLVFARFCNYSFSESHCV